MCAYLAALAAALAGCSASEVVQNLAPATAIDLPQPNYRRVVADNIKAVTRMWNLSVTSKFPGSD